MPLKFQGIYLDYNFKDIDFGRPYNRINKPEIDKIYFMMCKNKYYLYGLVLLIIFLVTFLLKDKLNYFLIILLQVFIIYIILKACNRI